MSRSIWNGTITFGLIAVPIKVHSATKDRGVHFHQVHAKDGARIKQRRMCSREGKEVTYGDVAHGYEVRGGEYVLLTQDEINAAAGERSRVIGLDEFVRAGEIDPVFYDRAYYLGAGKGGEAAYRLLHDGLERSGRAGLGRWVFHNREYLVAVRTSGDALLLHTMRFAAELVTARSLEVPKPSRVPSQREVEMARTLVESLQASFDPNAFKDEYRGRVLRLIKRKAKGHTIEIPEREQEPEQPDLMAALEASLEGTRKGSRASSRSGRSTGGGKAAAKGTGGGKAAAGRSKSAGKGRSKSGGKSAGRTGGKSAGRAAGTKRAARS
jgi:DNA end-binding protein Ku